ncbi:MAG: mannose-1-phosphate guanylyltransferase/mannose-6-phosphate isomerase [Oceanospirillales bacterium]|uniref:mannose-1-phosphate guanylyltransferase n=1 Tax=Marinobacterium halophilum TaxID=267374 RepID=A0A2P8EXC7_9GAMM|nr:mannose-1-phosphate guanylyltransferase/mannose-6-phosphate isomerase [Marinobacterium halophilum]MBR9829039.1 mannose-1-phosphate guanylyltransferase/mannose-6-phosphate isomerase [Oceanospirillales bacterium]PSL14118.1 mannose-1-phosphate guanylyltransferase [Marinobacterium halophilum]
MFTPVIMAGGSGSRLWPLSRQSSPKQFLDLDGSGSSLLQKTLTRLKGLNHAAPLIVSNDSYRFMVAEQLRQANIEPFATVLEPCSRNTAPAIALAALHLLQQGNDTIMLVLAADHHFTRPQELHQAINQGLPLAEQGKLVTFGIKPTRAETGYGYIMTGATLGESAFNISAFAEKPDLATAQAYLESGQHLWNSGMFMLRASAFLHELERHEPELLNHCKAAMASGTQDPDFIRPNSELFSLCPDNSIDYAVMEKTDNACVVAMDAGWSDIGSWQSLWEVSERDDNDNVALGDTFLHETRNSLIHAHHRHVATIGLDNHIVVETKDAVLVAHKDDAQKVKEVVQHLKANQRSEYSNHSHVIRPWGDFDTIDEGHRYQVKRITVQPGQQLSLQLHYHRAEHWIVVSGTAQVVCGDEEKVLAENQSTYIPVGVKHRLSNPGRIPLEVIEVQSGHYLGEDDIVRFTDIYGRCPGDA